MAYAEASDVTVRWGKADVEDEILALIGVRLDDVERQIKKRIPDLDTKVDDEGFLYLNEFREEIERLSREPAKPE